MPVRQPAVDTAKKVTYGSSYEGTFSLRVTAKNANHMAARIRSIVSPFLENNPFAGSLMVRARLSRIGIACRAHLVPSGSLFVLGQAWKRNENRAIERRSPSRASWGREKRVRLRRVGSSGAEIANIVLCGEEGYGLLNLPGPTHSEDDTMIRIPLFAYVSRWSIFLFWPWDCLWVRSVRFVP